MELLTFISKAIITCGILLLFVNKAFGYGIKPSESFIQLLVGQTAELVWEVDQNGGPSFILMMCGSANVSDRAVVTDTNLPYAKGIGLNFGNDDTGDGVIPYSGAAIFSAEYEKGSPDRYIFLLSNVTTNDTDTFQCKASWLIGQDIIVKKAEILLIVSYPTTTTTTTTPAPTTTTTAAPTTTTTEPPTTTQPTTQTTTNEPTSPTTNATTSTNKPTTRQSSTQSTTEDLATTLPTASPTTQPTTRRRATLAPTIPPGGISRLSKEMVFAISGGVLAFLVFVAITSVIIVTRKYDPKKGALGQNVDKITRVKPAPKEHRVNLAFQPQSEMEAAGNKVIAEVKERMETVGNKVVEDAKERMEVAGNKIVEDVKEKMEAAGSKFVEEIKEDGPSNQGMSLVSI